MKRFFASAVLGLAVLLCCDRRAVRAAAAPTPTRDLPQLNEEMKVWVTQIRAVEASGQPLVVANDGDASLARLKELLGPYVPAEKVKTLTLKPDGSFEIRLKEKHVIDIPYEAEHYIIRVTFNAKPIHGRLVEAASLTAKTPLTVLAFEEPQNIVIDRLDEQKVSTVPGIGKLLGLLPNIVALVYVEDAAGPRVAPQLNGFGVPENGRLFKELLKLDDTLLPENLLASAK